MQGFLDGYAAALSSISRILRSYIRFELISR